jgi:hypothetical protein
MRLDDQFICSAEPHRIFSALGHVINQNAYQWKAEDHKKPFNLSGSLTFCEKVNQINQAKYKMNDRKDNEHNGIHTPFFNELTKRSPG